MTASLYEQDFYRWLEKTAQHLREGRLEELDIPNLVEEIEAMGRSEKHAIQSNLIIVLLHLLKYKYQLQKRTSSWLSSIAEHRDRLEIAIADSQAFSHTLGRSLRSATTKLEEGQILKPIC